MPELIIKYNGKYGIYSTTVDAPTTCGMELVEFLKFYMHKYGEKSINQLVNDRLKRVEQCGCSSNFYSSLGDLFSLNRAGEKGEHLHPYDLLFNAGYIDGEYVRNDEFLGYSPPEDTKEKEVKEENKKLYAIFIDGDFGLLHNNGFVGAIETSNIEDVYAFIRKDSVAHCPEGCVYHILTVEETVETCQTVSIERQD